MEIDVSPQEQTVYELIGSDTNSCLQKSSFVVVDLITDLKIALPTAFSPNGDGVNDVFFVQA